MALDPNEAGKRVFIAYRQLHEIVKDGVGVSAAKANLISYNKILETLNQCFAIDVAFKDAVNHLHPVGYDAAHALEIAHKIQADGKVLLATAHSFIEMYLSADDKKKAFGFHSGN